MLRPQLTRSLCVSRLQSGPLRPVSCREIGQIYQVHLFLPIMGLAPMHQPPPKEVQPEIPLRLPQGRMKGPGAATQNRIRQSVQRLGCRLTSRRPQPIFPRLDHLPVAITRAAQTYGRLAQRARHHRLPRAQRYLTQVQNAGISPTGCQEHRQQHQANSPTSHVTACRPSRRLT